MPLSVPTRFYLRVVLTLLWALACALFCAWLRTPLPWMLGPLLGTAIVSILGAPVLNWGPLRNAAQGTIAAALGLYFTPSVVALVASLWWAIGLSFIWALVVGVAFGAWLQKMHEPSMPGLSRATTYFSSAIGGASEMSILSERYGGRPDLVASAHSLRILLVTVLVPFGMQFSGMHGIDVLPPGPREVYWPGLALLAVLASCGAWIMQKLGRANPWFMGSLLVSMGLTMAGLHLSAAPQWLSNGAQLVIGVSLGVRFTAEFIHTAPRWLATVGVGTVGLIVLCAGFAWLLSLGTHLHVATLILGTSPGGIAEMAITAKVLQLGVPVVTAFQVCRLVAVLMLVGPLYRYVVAAPETES